VLFRSQESIACAMLAADAESPLSAASPKEAVGETQAIVASSMSTPTAEAELGGSWPVGSEGAARSRGGTDSDGGSPMAMAGSFVDFAKCGARRYVTQTSIESSSLTGEAEASTIATALNVEKVLQAAETDSTPPARVVVSTPITVEPDAPAAESEVASPNAAESLVPRDAGLDSLAAESGFECIGTGAGPLPSSCESDAPAAESGAAPAAAAEASVPNSTDIDADAGEPRIAAQASMESSVEPEVLAAEAAASSPAATVDPIKNSVEPGALATATEGLPQPDAKVPAAGELGATS